MGRPPISLTEDQVREVETLAALLNQDQIADYLGIARNTFRAICARDAEGLERYKRGKAKAIAHVANGLLQRARAGCVTSSIFYLKTQAGWCDRPEPARPVPKDIPGDGPGATGGGAKLRMYLDAVAARQGVPQAIKGSAALANTALPPPEPA